MISSAESVSACNKDTGANHPTNRSAIILIILYTSLKEPASKKNNESRQIKDRHQSGKRHHADDEGADRDVGGERSKEHHGKRGGKEHGVAQDAFAGPGRGPEKGFRDGGFLHRDRFIALRLGQPLPETADEMDGEIHGHSQRETAQNRDGHVEVLADESYESINQYHGENQGSVADHG